MPSNVERLSMPTPIKNGKKPEPEISEKELLEAVEQIDWDAHWREVTKIMADEATAYERARAKSMEGSAQKVFL
jgi:hypothetical protein